MGDTRHGGDYTDAGTIEKGAAREIFAAGGRGVAGGAAPGPGQRPGPPRGIFEPKK